MPDYSMNPGQSYNDVETVVQKATASDRPSRQHRSKNIESSREKDSSACQEFFPPTSKLPFGKSRKCRASSISVQPGGSMEQMLRPRRSFRRRISSSVKAQGIVGRHASTFAEKLWTGIVSQRGITY